MKAIKLIKSFIIFVIVSILMLASNSKAFAESTKTCTVEIPCIVNETSRNSTVDIEISSSDNSYSNVVTVKSNKDTTFRLDFNKFGNYHYYVRQKYCSDPTVILDKSVYTVDILVQDIGDRLISVATVYIPGRKKTDKIKFENSVFNDNDNNNNNDNDSCDDNNSNGNNDNSGSDNSNDDNNNNSDNNNDSNNNDNNHTNPNTGATTPIGLLFIIILATMIVVLKPKRGNSNDR